MTVRSTMTMRATVSRNLATGKDPHGQPVLPSFVEIEGGLPIRAWSKSRRDVDDSNKNAVIEDMRAHVPVSADVKNGDQLVIVDRLGVAIFDGPVFVETASRKGGPGSRASHQELMLTRHL